MRRTALVIASLAATLLAGCDMLGIDSPEKVAAARDADGRAIGGACRHAGRAIEDCYVLNKKADRAAVFAGWRDMNDYMRENKIEAVAPQLSSPVARAGARGGDAAPDGPAPSEKVADRADRSPEKNAEKAAEKGADRNAEKAADRPSEKSADKSGDKSADKAGTKADKAGAKDAARPRTHES